jgi:hypothetical protein
MTTEGSSKMITNKSVIFKENPTIAKNTLDYNTILQILENLSRRDERIHRIEPSTENYRRYKTIDRKSVKKFYKICVFEAISNETEKSGANYSLLILVLQDRPKNNCSQKQPINFCH